MPVFGEQSFAALEAFIEGISNFFEANLIFALIGAIILFVFIFFQQVILSSLLHVL